MRRREFIVLLGGSATAVAWPLNARAQKGAFVKRIGILMNLAADDPEGQTRLAVLLQGLRELGWIDGENVRIDTRWAAADADRFRSYASELVALMPDVILAATGPAVAALQHITRTVPIIFVDVIDPVGAGFVSSLARPGGNITGFTIYEYSISAKWLELLKRIAPNLSRVAVVRDPTLVSGTGQLAAIQAVASSFGVESSPVDVRDANEMEAAIAAFARSPSGGGDRVRQPIRPSSSKTAHRPRSQVQTARNLLCALLRARWRSSLLRA